MRDPPDRDPARWARDERAVTVRRLTREPSSAHLRLTARLAPAVRRMLELAWPEDQLRQLEVRLVNTATTHISLEVVEVVEVSQHHSALSL